MKKSVSLRREIAVDPIEWLPGSLGARFPRVEDQFKGMAAVKREANNRRMREYKAQQKAARGE